MDSVFACLIIGGGHHASAFPPTRISPYHNGQPAKGRILTLLNRSEEGVHIKVAHNSHEGSHR